MKKALRLDAYERLYADLVQAGSSPVEAAIAVSEAYLDGKPRTHGKHKIAKADRDAAFWSRAC